MRRDPIQPAEWAELAQALAGAPPRTQAIVLTLAEAALRRREAAGLRVGDLHDLRGPAPYIEVKTMLKRAKQPRKVYISPELADTLLRVTHGRDAEDHVFLGERGPLTGHGIWRVVAEWSRAHGRHVRPHLLRHLGLTAYQALHKDIAATQARAGHADPRTTTEFYLDPWHREAAARAAALGAWMSGSAGGSTSARPAAP